MTSKIVSVTAFQYLDRTFSFAVNDCMYETRQAWYQTLAILLDDCGDPNFLDCLPPSLCAWRLLHVTLSFIVVQSVDWIGFLCCPRSIPEELVSWNQLLPWSCDMERHLIRNSGSSFCFFFQQFHVFGCIYSGVKQNEIHTSTAMAGHGTPNHFARRVYLFRVFFRFFSSFFWCGYNTSVGKTLAQWLTNVHMARYKLLNENNTCFHSAGVQWRWHLAKYLSFPSSLVTGATFVPACDISIQFDDSIVHCCLEAMQFSTNVPFCALVSAQSYQLWPSNLCLRRLFSPLQQ